MSVRKIILALTILLGIIIAPAPLPILGSVLREGAYVADTVPEGKPRFTVRKTGTENTKSLRKKSADLRDPDNLKTEVIYDEKDDTYTIGTSLVGSEESGSGRGGSSSRNTSTRNSSTTSTQASSTGAAGASSGSILPGRSGFTLGTATSFLNAPLLMTPEE